jgi:heme oxygenase (biliverdin-IX-beta and delta-forming)
MSIIERIRTSTAELHQSVERTEAAKSVMSPQVSREDYCRFLQRTLIMHEAVEQMIYPQVSDVVTSVPLKPKREAILSDLSRMNSTAVLPHIYFNGRYKLSYSFHLGMLYVLEGSSMGGKVISLHLGKTLGDVPASFFNIYGNQVGSQWKRFIECLENYHADSSEEERQLTVDGAVYGFERALYIYSADLKIS